MPTELKNAKPGDLLRYRLQIGTFYCNATRKITQVLANGKRFIVEGRNSPIVEAKDVLRLLISIQVLNDASQSYFRK